MSNSTLSLNSKTIGVVGGGQLAQMLGEAASKRNIDFAVQTVSNSDPASIYANKVFLANQKDVAATREMAKICYSITFENEWVDIDKLIELEKEGVNFIPNLNSIKPLINKISQKTLLSNLSIPGAEWLVLSSVDLSENKLPDDWSFPLMAKASLGGYDGKGTRVIRDFSELNQLIKTVDNDSWFLEKWVDYEHEYSLVATRDVQGNFHAFPVVETNQYNQICDWVLAPAEISHPLEVMAYNIASSLMNELNYFGVIAIEFFYGKGGLVVNEIAPRTHNSAHFSIEACKSSQFDQQICIAAGLPITQPELLVPGALMINLLGLPKGKYSSLDERLTEIRNIDGVNLHWYEKEQEIPGRKLGHVTFLLRATDPTLRRKEAMDLLKKIRSIWPIQ